MPRIPEQCPTCQSQLVITGLTCPNCGTQVQGHFHAGIFSQLSSNDFDFVVLFLKTKGNIKEMERELGISYWTIRNKLSAIVEQLGLDDGAAPASAKAEQRQDILQSLNDGEITVDEAAELLEQLRGK